MNEYNSSVSSNELDETEELEYSTNVSSSSNSSNTEDSIFNTQELKYSTEFSLNYSDENFSTSQHSSDNEIEETTSTSLSSFSNGSYSIDDRLKPFNFEPVCSPRREIKEVSSDEESLSNSGIIK